MEIENQMRMMAENVLKSGTKTVYLYPARKSERSHENLSRRMLLANLLNDAEGAKEYGHMPKGPKARRIALERSAVVEGYVLVDVDAEDYR